MIAYNPVLHSRTKHLELDIHFVCERVVSKALNVQHVPATAQIADALTKPLPTTQFHELKSKVQTQGCSTAVQQVEFEGRVIEDLKQVSKSAKPLVVNEYFELRRTKMVPYVNTKPD